MLNFLLFCTAEGLCRKFAKNHRHGLPWGGRHVIMLGDPAQLPSPGRRDIFGTHFRRNPVLGNVLAKVMMGSG